MDGLQVMVLAATEPLRAHPLRIARALEPVRILLALGDRAAADRTAAAVDDLEVILQEPHEGIGPALLRAEPPPSAADGHLLMLPANLPLLRRHTVQELLELHTLEANAATILTAEREDPRGQSRVLRDGSGHCLQVLPPGDLSAEQEAICEVASGVVAYRTRSLLGALPSLQSGRAPGMDLLADLVTILLRQGLRVGCYVLREPSETSAADSAEELSAAEETLRRRERAGGAECVLCASASADQPPLRLASGEHMHLDVAAQPFNSGHLLLYPGRHVSSLLSLRPAEQAELDRFLRQGEDLLRRLYRFEGLNVGCNSGAGEHLTIHLVPRWGGDLNYLPLFAGLKLVPESPQRTWERLREGMP